MRHSTAAVLLAALFLLPSMAYAATSATATATASARIVSSGVAVQLKMDLLNQSLESTGTPRLARAIAVQSVSPQAYSIAVGKPAPGDVLASNDPSRNPPVAIIVHMN
jgi:hypothetical protein